MSFQTQPFRPNLIEKVLISPKINFNSLSSNMVGNNELLALQAEKKQLFEASNNIFGSTGLTQNEMNNLRMISSEIRTYNTTYLQSIQGKSMEESFNKFKNQMCLSSSLEPNDLQYFLEMTFPTYLELLKTKPEIISNYINQCQYDLLTNIEYKTVNQSEVKNIEEFARINMNQMKHSSNVYNNYNINNMNFKSIFDSFSFLCKRKTQI